ncbi:hypothetical protein CFC21_090669 [Triticum aestivum]|uniref:DOG1 domain-containing protein n=2 Tax=Triticum aestivum TaxID=4565 RepID=A0A9R1LEP6_WHEAT|nr:uncharacterized protein LOC123142886 [Triticum aestivum]KAF7087488.1 hypothetical protein CFC21_090669 [Triticum aestivum]
MLYEIHSHAQIQALQARSDELGHSNEDMVVNLVSLESVRIARESYSLLWPLTKEPMSLACPELDSLLVVATLSLEIQKLEHDVLPKLMVQESKLERGFLEALLVMQNSAIKLLHLAKCYKEAKGVLQDLVSGRAEDVSRMLNDIVVNVLRGNIFWLQVRLPVLARLVTIVLETPVRFCDSDE